jgi:serralysin
MTIAPNVEALVLIGSDGVAARGDADADELQGNGAGNRLTGGGGNDRLLGKGGADLLDGGAGADRLTGGSAGDTFRFSTAAASDGDTIADFRLGQDRIDLRAIDADSVATGDQAFDFVGRAAFSERAGELRAGPGWLAADLDGDGRADFAMRLAWDVEVGAADILL